MEGDGEAQLLEQRVARRREGSLVLAVFPFQRVVARLRLLELVARHVLRHLGGDGAASLPAHAAALSPERYLAPDYEPVLASDQI